MSSTELADAVVAYLDAHAGQWYNIDQLVELAPITAQPRTAYAHDLDDVESERGFAQDATGLAATQPSGTVERHDRGQLLTALMELARDGRVESRDPGGWREYRRPS